MAEEIVLQEQIEKTRKQYEQDIAAIKSQQQVLISLSEGNISVPKFEV
jgi:hypothetical protein